MHRAFAIVLLFSPILQAQLNPDCLKRTLVVNVRDRTGKLVEGLNSSSFRASLQGQQVRISSAIVRNGPRRIVLLVDASGSVNKENHEWDTVRLIAGNFPGFNSLLQACVRILMRGLPR